MKKLLLLTILLNFSSTSAKGIIATITLLKGSGSVLFPGAQHVVPIKKGMKLLEDTSILTNDKTFVKISFLAGGKTSIGANTKIVLVKGGKKKATFVSLLKGQIRANIPKKSGRVHDNLKHKLIIKTRHASLGVRGTEFLTVHNPENHITSMITFKGEVAFVKVKKNLLSTKVEKRILGLMQVDDFDAILDGKDSEVVREGRYSGVIPTKEIATIPTKISPKQYEILKSNVNLDFDNKSEVVSNGEKDKKGTYKTYVDDPPAEGFYDDETGAYAPRSGGYLDIETSIYVQPDPGSKLDKKNNVYILSDQFGGVDEKTGDYIPPEGLSLTASKGFVIKDMTNAEQLRIASKVFGIDVDGILTPKIKRNLKKSLSQMLFVKKAILNNEIRDELLDLEDSDVDGLENIAREFRRALDSIKEVLEVNTSLALGTSSNVTDQAFGQTFKVSNVSSSFLEFDFEIKHNNYLLSNWVSTPYFGFELTKYFSSHENVKSSSLWVFNIGIENKISHGFGDLNIDLEVKKASKLEKNNMFYESFYNVESVKHQSESSFFYQFIEVSVKEKIKIDKWRSVSFGADFKNYDTFSETLNGKQFNYWAELQGRFLPRYELVGKYLVSDRSSKQSIGKTSKTGFSAQFNIYEIYTRFTFRSEFSNFSLKHKDSVVASSKGVEKESTLKFGLDSELGINFSIGLNQEFIKVKSLLNEANYKESKTMVSLNYTY
ncbi:hypothetical protein A9Q84_00865 [Halobacteriovorax marinus]|uniref:FecR protein domain-containing protein n=1 Tax=Halobacteriovorax marinus TaxID=97084 RepID=A0A1Y5FBU6_9BACT|nr:hypothetical protein A9Q84_00865 [Halobacteriovorax marinus]